MRIAVIGGRYKNEGQLSRIARAQGHELEFEEGHMKGRDVDSIRSAVARSGPHACAGCWKRCSAATSFRWESCAWPAADIERGSRSPAGV